MTGYDRVAPRLWQGAAPDPAQAYAGFDVLVLCAKQFQPLMPKFKGLLIRAPFDDTPRPGATERRIAIRAAREVAKSLRAGRNVLVTCQAGWNRSGLVVGLSLRMAARFPVDEIVSRIRRARGPHALSNEAFERILRGFGRSTSS